MKWLEKICYFLYDVLGIFLPGVLTIILVNKVWFDGKLNPELFTLESVPNKEIYFALVSIMFLYILGNILKVVSQIFYDTFEIIFDQMLFKILTFILKEISSMFKEDNYLVKFLKTNILVKFLKKYLNNIFSFKVEKYFSTSEEIIIEVDKKIFSSNIENNDEIRKKWYKIYKIGKIFEDNEGIKSLSSVFLAKYTLYRSLSFIFFINFIFFLSNKNYRELISKIRDIKLNFGIVLLISFVSWLTFHMKYKKYYTLCGNETLMALYYKVVLKDERRKDEIIIC